MKMFYKSILIASLLTLMIGCDDGNADYSINDVTNCTLSSPCYLESVNVSLIDSVYLSSVLDESCLVQVSNVNDNTIVNLTDLDNSYDMPDEKWWDDSLYVYDIDLEAEYLLSFKTTEVDDVNITVSCNP